LIISFGFPVTDGDLIAAALAHCSVEQWDPCLLSRCRSNEASGMPLIPKEAVDGIAARDKTQLHLAQD
jgi:hypothetical protein